MERIPGPRGLPIIGNLLNVQHEEGFLKAMENMADIYGPVYQITIAGKRSLVVTSAELLKQFSDETQWAKIPPPVLTQGPGPRGLFAAHNEDPDWAQAHRILAPAFGPLAIGEMFEGMKDIAYQMILKWARQDENHKILLTDEFTRLTLDTIALCTMDYRLNSFYSDDMHPFVDSMLTFLTLSQKLGFQPAVVNKLLGSSDKTKVKEASDLMNKIAQDIIDKRKANPKEKNDMLNVLLYGKDPKTGKSMRDELIVSEMITFLIAGHETTSGLISFAFMNLLSNPRTYLKAQQEVDEILGSGALDLEKIKDLKYLNAVLRETLRLTPTAPLILKGIPPHRQNEVVTICDGKYRLEKNELVRVLLGKSMRDPTYFGEDAAEFIPERMLEDNPDFAKFHKAWKPFGNGSRSCIGQAFAWQESLMIIALILQNFDMSFVDPSYKVKIKQTLTVKPDELYARVRPRKGLDGFKIEQRLFNRADNKPSEDAVKNETPANVVSSNNGPTILFGSNSGTCQSLAQKLSSALAIKHGASATVQELDAAVNNLPTEQPVIIITASYEGLPPDNAARFLTWLESSKARVGPVKYAVFGCGHIDWRETYQRVPTKIDELLGKHGAERILPMGSTDVSRGKVLDDFNQWQEELFQKIYAESASGSGSLAPKAEDLAEISTSARAEHLASGLSLGKVKEIRSLTEPGEPEKRHIEIELPEGIDYEAGDYLSVLPVNPEERVRRVIKHFGLPVDAVMTLKASAFGSLPVNTPLSIYALVKGYFELSHPISKSDIEAVRQFTDDKDTLKYLDQVLSDDDLFAKQIAARHISLFDLLVEQPAIKMPFQTFLSSLLPVHIRQYSISSSPLANPRTCTLTYTVVRHASPTYTENEHTAYAHEGVASTYLSTLSPGDSLQLAIKRTATANLPCPFRLPDSTAQSTTPLIMYCAGTGLAPFRGFIQQRAIILEQNPSAVLAPAILFIGCRSATTDRIYADELASWEKLGAVSLRYAFSQDPDHKLAQGCKYVGDRILKDQAELRELWAQGAKAYMCGSRKVQESVKECVGKIFEIMAKEQGWSVETMQAEREKFRGTLAGRAVSDVFD